MILLEDRPSRVAGGKCTFFLPHPEIVRETFSSPSGCQRIVSGPGRFGHGGVVEAVFADVGVLFLAVFNSLFEDAGG